MSQALQVENPLPAGNKSESIYGTITCFFVYVWRFRDNLHVNQNNAWQSSKANQGHCNVRWRSKYKIPRRITDQSSYSRHLRCFLPRVSTALNFSRREEAGRCCEDVEQVQKKHQCLAVNEQLVGRTAAICGGSDYDDFVYLCSHSGHSFFDLCSLNTLVRLYGDLFAVDILLWHEDAL